METILQYEFSILSADVRISTVFDNSCYLPTLLFLMTIYRTSFNQFPNRNTPKQSKMDLSNPKRRKI